jgi:hypothetical protein
MGLQTCSRTEAGAFNREIGVRRKALGRHQRANDPFRIEPRLRLCMVPARRAGERQSGQPIGKLTRKRATDRTKTGNGDAGWEHDRMSEAVRAA